MPKQRNRRQRYTNPSRTHGNNQHMGLNFGSNSDRLQDLGGASHGGSETQIASAGPDTTQPGQEISLDMAFGSILNGNWDQAKSLAHAAAQQARSSNNVDTASHAGLIWQMADALNQAQGAIQDESYTSAQSYAHKAANVARSLMPTGAVDPGGLQTAIDGAGEVWNVAKKGADSAREKQANSGEVPVVDQHELDHWNNGAFCGIATMVMMMRANQINQGTSNADLNQLANQVYHPGQGTSGAQMAAVLRDRGLKDSQYTTTGTFQKLVQSLDKGQTVPFGVVRCEGTITRLEGGSSERYRGARVGDQHYRQFGASGHWVLVVRYEGKAKAPSAFIVNDPDLGGEMRCTPDQLDRMGAKSGNYWMVHQ